MNALGKRAGCAVELAIDLLRGKWKPVILARLKDGPLRYGELRSLIPAISDKVLTDRLTDLKELGFVEAVAGERGLYQLTEHGRQARPVLQALFDWGEAEAKVFGVTLGPVPQDT